MKINITLETYKKSKIAGKDFVIKLKEALESRTDIRHLLTDELFVEKMKFTQRIPNTSQCDLVFKNITITKTFTKSESKVDITPTFK